MAKNKSSALWIVYESRKMQTQALLFWFNSKIFFKIFVFIFLKCVASSYVSLVIANSDFTSSSILVLVFFIFTYSSIKKLPHYTFTPKKKTISATKPVKTQSPHFNKHILVRPQLVSINLKLSITNSPSSPQHHEISKPSARIPTSTQTTVKQI